MRRLPLFLAVFVLMAAPVHAQAAPTLSQQYLSIYVKMHDSETLEKNGDYAGALKSFQECYDALAAMQKNNPDWEPALIEHRMDDCKVTIAKLQNKLAPQPTTSGTATAVTSVTTPPDNPASPAASRPASHNYPWKTNIKTTMFYIGEASSTSGAWDEKWVNDNHGTDNPNERNGYAPNTHASTINPFYVALPFNDLAYPDKAKQYLPAWWQRPPKNGKPVSACKDRWVEIKTEDGRVCYAQWEDAGPERQDFAEYVFGDARPEGNHAGLDVSPAVFQYLGLAADKNPTTRWRFVDIQDLPPGAWLKYDEQAIIYAALHGLKETASSSTKKPAESSPPAPAIAPTLTKP